MANTLEKRKIAHELVEAWQQATHYADTDIDPYNRMYHALNAIIADYTPGYNAESDPEAPEEYIPGTTLPSRDALAAAEYVEVSYGVWVPRDMLAKVVQHPR